MKPNFSFLSKLLILQYLSVLCISQEFDFFYFVQQWPGAYCDTKQSCCYPKTGKPAIYHILVLEVNCLASTLKVLNLTVILPNTLSFSFHLWV
ncbi:hypothetical protein JHK87_040414 [Glycine soja]|uniref:Uncharacterized protein n=2 Tax=Glycine subgen. Soja TaxID=1462606 RepID=A0A0R0EXZ2_SOYBN|nr:hypothetical protein JHK87_040414 [Glycine soja]KAG4963969.1 hypothetical protein JHK86_040837 [Glycine max]